MAYASQDSALFREEPIPDDIRDDRYLNVLYDDSLQALLEHQTVTEDILSDEPQEQITDALPSSTPTREGIDTDAGDHTSAGTLGSNSDLTNSMAETSPSGAGLFSAAELAKRDVEAVAYTRGLLLEGDTLVFMAFPGNTKCYDVTGFAISDAPHIVHSSRLLATGSSKFAEMLGDWQQHRIRGRRKMRGTLPSGIKYILDLTPPEEGDEAVELTADLSCTLGVREWHRTGYRCRVSENLISGKEDVFTVPIGAHVGSLPASSTAPPWSPINDGEAMGVGAANSNTACNNQESNSLTQSAAGAKDEFVRAIALSKQDQAKRNRSPERRYIPEYDPLRHRAGIARLLQVIEGKDPQLNSATKVWTLFALAKHFDCSSAVTDWIVAWLHAEPNTQFIEILPEVSCKIGFGLHNPMITRAAFSILVSEEALSIVSRGIGKLEPDKRGQNQFGRPKEDVDEDLKTRLEYASRSFAEKITLSFDELIEPQMLWLETPSEHMKLSQFESHIATYAKANSHASSWIAAVTSMKELLRRYIRDRILSTLKMPLLNEYGIYANDHRRVQNYTSDADQVSFYKIYADLAGEERIMTTFFWRQLLSVSANLRDLGKWQKLNFTDKENLKMVGAMDALKVVTIDDLELAQARMNRAIMEAIEEQCYVGGTIPPECWFRSETQDNYPGDAGTSTSYDPWTAFEPPPTRYMSDDHDTWRMPATTSVPETNSFHSKLTSAGSSPDKTSFQTTSLPLRPHEVPFAQQDSSVHESVAQQLRNAQELCVDSAPLKPDLEPKVTMGYKIPPDWMIDSNSVFFNLPGFMRQISDNLTQVCTQMLDTSDISFSIRVTDTLLCLGPQELKYLPLWAGGDDDDTGGVFEEDIPAALMGPNGPGPSFHTGFSNVSAANSVVDSDGGSQITSVDTSVHVQDGNSDQIHRRRVVSDDGLRSESFSEDSDMYTRDKGKGIDRSQYPNYDVSHIASSVAPSETASSATMNSTMTSLDGSDASFESAVLVDHEEDSDTDTLQGDIDEDMWDGSDTESFDFGDDPDEDMSTS
ncbi:MAG: hypothetical protein M1818_003841 [Claussenomyces sp. TS43310]|nr:MAG: hypothetical protein M1818_003841 [Claussenomyces sp. TS43310]